MHETSKLLDCDQADKQPAAMRWKVLRLASEGFFVNFQPSEPFLTWYILRHKGVSKHQLNGVVWPCDTYGALLFTLPMALYAERVGYRRALLIGMACREATRMLLLFARGVAAMAVMQLTYAGAIAAHNAVYVAHAIACVPAGRAPATASYTNAANALGFALGVAGVRAGPSVSSSASIFVVFRSLSSEFWWCRCGASLLLTTAPRRRRVCRRWQCCLPRRRRRCRCCRSRWPSIRR